MADDLRGRLQNEGLNGFSLAAAEREDALAALRELEGTGATLLDAARHYRRHHRPPGGDKSVAEAVSELLEFKRGRQQSRKRYLQDLSSRLSRFAAVFGRRLLKDVTSDEIEQWLYADKTIGEVTRENYFRALMVFFNFARGRRAGRGFTAQAYRVDNPMEAVNRPVVADEAPKILSVDQARNLLTTAHVNDERRGMLAFVTLGLFAGLRSTELTQITWNNVRLDGEDSYVTVPGGIAKKRRIRNVPIPKAARGWLAIAWKNPSGWVAPPNSMKRLSEVSAGAGISPWPTNAMRHSFGSYAYAKYEDAAKVSAWLGHASDGILFAHYRALASKRDGEQFFNIQPPKGKEKSDHHNQGVG